MVAEGYKQTEIGVIPVDWEVKTIESLTPQNKKFGIVDGPFGSNLKTIHYKTKGIPIITSGYVTSGKFIANNYIFVDKEKFIQEKRSAVYPGDIVMAKIGANCGASAILPLKHEVGILSGNALKITIDEKQHATYYIWQILWSLYANDEIEELKSVGAQPAISMANLKKYLLPIPPKPEQKAIATALSDVDGLIASLESLIKKKENIKTATMQQLLTGKKRLDGFSGEWVEKTIGDFGVFKSGSGFPTRFQGDKKNKIPFYKVSDMNNKGNNIAMKKSNNYISEAVRKIINATIFPKNSIVFAKIGAAIFLERKKVLTVDSCIDNNMMAYIVNEEIAEFKYFHYLFLNIELGKLVSATALPSLSGKDIANLKFLFPQKDEQKAIAAILTVIDSDIEVLKTKLQKIKAIKAGMMQELLTGKTRLSFTRESND